MKNDRKLSGGFLFTIFLLFVFAGLVVYIFFHIKIDSYTEKLNGDYEITHGLIVYDQGKPIISTLFFLHPQSHRGALYYIPENTGTIIETLDQMDRIDELFDPENPRPYLDKIDRMLGTSTDFYLSISLDHFAAIIDWLGGVDVFVPQPVWLSEAEPAVYLPSGSFTLDGGKLKSYLTYRLPEDLDTDLINRKLNLCKSVLSGLASMNHNTDNEAYWNLIYGFLDTDMDKQSFLSFLEELESMQLDRIITQKVMGRTEIVDGKELLFPLYEERLLKEMVAQIVDNLANPESGMDDAMTLSVEIQNGTSINGLASRTAQLFKSYGFRIASVKNADRNNYDNTLILDKKENPAAAQRVANIIRCDQIFQSTETTTDETVDVIIILGKDFDGRYVK